MSSPVAVKVTRPVPSWPKDYHTSVAELESNDLLRSTLMDECRVEKGDTKTCLFCGFRYFWRTIRCREHLGLTETSKQVQKCKPYPEHVESSSQVVKELKERDTHDNQEGKRCLESGQRCNVIDVESFNKRDRTSNDGPFKIVRTREEVDM